MHTRNSILQFFRLFCLGSLFLIVIGCGKSTGTVMGKVTLKGEPLPVGSVNFVSASGNAGDSGFAVIQSDGTYIATVPTGKMKVFISAPGEVPNTTGPKYGGSGGAPKAMKSVGKNVPPKDFGKPKGVEIPDNYFPTNQKFPKISNKYLSPDSSNLTLDVKSGENKFDIPLD